MEKKGPPGAARTIPVEAIIESGRSDDFIRVVARLSDGREREDAQLLQGANYQSEIDIQLAQFQVLVTDRDGNPVGGLSPEDFEIREDRRKLPAVALHTSYDVPLVLGLAIDSSDSMLAAWGRLKYIARTFLETAVGADDRAFLVDFDDTVRLIQPLTGDGPLLSERLDYLIPMGGTALSDGLLFSLLQYRSEPGRRALVVITDGVDENSRSRPEQSSEFAERLGLPIYFIELDNSRAGTSGAAAVRRNRERLRRIAEETGGRPLPPGAPRRHTLVGRTDRAGLRADRRGPATPARSDVLHRPASRSTGRARDPGHPARAEATEPRCRSRGSSSRTEETALTAPAPLQAPVVRRFVPAALVLTVCLSLPEAAHAQDQRRRAAVASETAVAIGPLLGPWMRNEELSEDPITTIQAGVANPKARRARSARTRPGPPSESRHRSDPNPGRVGGVARRAW